MNNQSRSRENEESDICCIDWTGFGVVKRRWGLSSFRSVCSGCEGRVRSCEFLVFRLSGRVLVSVFELL